jgi:hypothetical protein
METSNNTPTGESFSPQHHHCANALGSPMLLVVKIYDTEGTYDIPKTRELSVKFPFM